MQEPETPDFDFDAHIANLIAKSERDTTCAVAPRGWDNDDHPDGEWDEDSDDSGHFDEGEFDLEMEGQYMDDHENADRTSGDNEHFEKVMEDYNEDDIGGLSEVCIINIYDGLYNCIYI